MTQPVADPDQAEGSVCGIALMQEQGMKQVPDMRAAATHEMDAR